MQDARQDTTQDILDDFAVRELHAEDRQSMIECFIELQEHERQFEHRRLPGVEMASRYIDSLMEHCRSERGKMFVASLRETAVGFVCVFPYESLDSDLNTHVQVAYICDLVVREEYRGRGIGKELMKIAEQYAIANGATDVFVNVLAGNNSARDFYAQAGYVPYELSLVKKLPGEAQ